MSLEDIKAGLSYVLEDTIKKEQTINRMGTPGAEVLSTPSLLSLMEWASIHATDNLLPDTHTSVGYAVDEMRHLAPTAIGQKVAVTSVVTEVDRNKITYKVEAREGDKVIGRAIHKRAIIQKQ